MKLPDVNVLVYASNRDSPWYEAASALLATAGKTPGGLGLAWGALLGFLRVTTRPGALVTPLKVTTALDLTHGWLEAPGAVLIAPGQQHFELLSSLLHLRGTAGNLTPEAHLAALAIEHGATLVSNDADFERFPGLSFERLRQTP